MCINNAYAGYLIEKKNNIPIINDLLTYITLEKMGNKLESPKVTITTCYIK